MPKIRFKELEYDAPGIDDFTNREMMDVERISGHEAAEIFEMVQRRQFSFSVVVAIAHIAIRRSGATVTLDEILDAKMSDFEIVADTALEASADPGPLLEDAASIPDADTEAVLVTNGDQPSPTSSESDLVTSST